MTEKPVTGRCSCGAVSYICSEAQKFSMICQCRQCQRITGTGHAAQFAVARSKTTLSGDVSKYRLTSDAGNEVTSAFCGICGNPVYKTTSMAPDLMVIHAATLDDPASYKPDMVVHAESAQAWDHVDPGLPRKS